MTDRTLRRKNPTRFHRQPQHFGPLATGPCSGYPQDSNPQHTWDGLRSRRRIADIFVIVPEPPRSWYDERQEPQSSLLPKTLHVQSRHPYPDRNQPHPDGNGYRLTCSTPASGLHTNVLPEPVDPVNIQVDPLRHLSYQRQCEHASRCAAHQNWRKIK